MAASTAALANAALRHLGVTGAITTLSSDVTTEGKAAAAFYDRARRETLAEAPWQCAKKTAALTLIQEIVYSDTREWTHQYRLPEDCITPRRILWGQIRNPRADQQVPFVLGADTDATAWSASTAYVVGDYASLSGAWYRCTAATTNNTPPNASYWTAITDGPPKWLFCDFADAILEYTMDLTDPTRFDTDLESAIVARLAYYIAPSVGAAMDLRAEVGNLWVLLNAQARANDYNARQRDLPAVSGLQAARYRGAR